MHRTLNKPVSLPKNVEVSGEKINISFKGPMGQSTLALPDFLTLTKSEGYLTIKADNMDEKKQIIIGATYRQLVNNKIIGVSVGFKKILILEGVGYRANVEQNKLNLSLGYSHPIVYHIPAGVKASVEGNNKVVLQSHEKQLLGQTAAEIKQFRKPEPYKGKGVRYEGEVIRRKAGKTGKK